MCKEFGSPRETRRIENRNKNNPDLNSDECIKLYSVVCNVDAFAITNENPNEIQQFKFGMTPFYSMATEKIINIKAEEVIKRWYDPGNSESISDLIQTVHGKNLLNKRCLVFANIYSEISDQDKAYMIYIQSFNKLFAFAGVYEAWNDPATNEIVKSFAIITTKANSLLQSLGIERMPVILKEPDEMKWIDTSSKLSNVLSLLAPYPSDMMVALPIIKMEDFHEQREPKRTKPEEE